MLKATLCWHSRVINPAFCQLMTRQLCCKGKEKRNKALLWRVLGCMSGRAGTFLWRRVIAASSRNANLPASPPNGCRLWGWAAPLKSSLWSDADRPGRRLLLLLGSRGLVLVPAQIWEYLAVYSRGSLPWMEFSCRMKSLKWKMSASQLPSYHDMQNMQPAVGVVVATVECMWWLFCSLPLDLQVILRGRCTLSLPPL